MANEFLIKARLTALDVHLPGWFEKTVDYFKQSLKAAVTLDNVFEYAVFLHQHNDFNSALPFYEKALTASRGLAETNPQTYLPYVAMTLNNLAVLQKVKNEFQAAETAYNEALAIYRHLAETNPQTYLPDVATTLNNLAVLQKAKNEFPAAETAYNEALAIRRPLAETNPETYLPDVAMTSVNMSMFYQNSMPDRETSVAYAKEALIASLPFLETLPAARKYAESALRVAEGWGLDKDAFWEEAAKAWRSDEGLDKSDKND